MTKAAAIYARKSTAQDASDDAKSVTRQLALGRAFAEEKGWRVVAEFADDAVSGALTSKLVNRARMLAAAAEGKFSAVVVRDYDRLSRDDREGPAFIYSLEDLGLEIWYYSDRSRVDTRTALSRGMLSMKATFAAAEREAAAARTHEALRAKAQRGHVPNGVCFGYRNVREGDHSVRAIVPDEATVIVKIFEMASAGQGYMRIARTLNDVGAPAPSPRRPGRRASWSTTTVRDALNREAYRGRIVWNVRQRTTRRGKRVAIRRPEREWVQRTDESLRIIPEPLWASAHDRLRATRSLYFARNNGFTGRPVPGTESPYLLTGFLSCGACGGTMFSHRHGHHDREFFSYLCTQYHVRGRSVCKNGLEAAMVDADEAVLASVEHDLLNVPVLETALYKAMSALQPPRDRDHAQARPLRAEVAKLEASISRLAVAVAEGGDLPALLAEMREREARRARLAAELVTLEREAATRQDSGTVARALDTMRAAIADLRGTLHADISSARRTLRSLLAGRLVFTPQEREGERFYAFEGPGTVSPVIAGALPKALGSPR
jgi:site-specific DNA recombinase